MIARLRRRCRHRAAWSRSLNLRPNVSGYSYHTIHPTAAISPQATAVGTVTFTPSGIPRKVTTKIAVAAVQHGDRREHLIAFCKTFFWIVTVAIASSVSRLHTGNLLLPSLPEFPVRSVTSATLIGPSVGPGVACKTNIRRDIFAISHRRGVGSDTGDDQIKTVRS